MKLVLRAFLMIAFLMTGVAAQQPAPPSVDVNALGPQVGETVPDFSAVDQFGDARTLESIMGPNGAMLVFNRSADW
jgi:hypothetical protein